jgi:nicotinamidase-related amidase
MDRTKLLSELERSLPVELGRATLPPGNVGLVLVDVVQGFTRQGPMADPDSMGEMVRAVDALVRDLDGQLGERLHLLVLRDCHSPDVPEPPYPPHCLVGTEESQLDPGVAWLAGHERATILDKDCINGFVGAMRRDGPHRWRNLLVEWVCQHGLRALVLAGDCTDICVSDLCVALLSARNHGMLTTIPAEQREAYAAAITSMPILVHVPACSTFDLDPDGAIEGPETLRHPRALAHHVGLWVMASRGAQLVDGFSW